MSPRRTSACRALRVVAPLAASLCAGAIAFARRRAVLRKEAAFHIPWERSSSRRSTSSSSPGVVYFLRNRSHSFLKERSDLLRKSIDDAAKARGGAEAVRHRDPHRETGRRDRGDE